MKTLLLMRHSKSSWDDAEMADFDRPLNKRGKRDAPWMGTFLHKQGAMPDLIVSSSAARARATASEVAQAMGFGGTVHFEESLYHATPGELIDQLNGLPDRYTRVMLVGHNPGMEQLLAGLAGRAEMFPTAAVAWIDLPIKAWADLQINTPGDLKHMWRPKELQD